MSILEVADILIEIPQEAVLKKDPTLSHAIAASDSAAIGGLSALAAVMNRFRKDGNNCSFTVESNGSVWPADMVIRFFHL